MKGGEKGWIRVEERWIRVGDWLMMRWRSGL